MKSYDDQRRHHPSKCTTHWHGDCVDLRSTSHRIPRINTPNHPFRSLPPLSPYFCTILTILQRVHTILSIIWNQEIQSQTLRWRPFHNFQPKSTYQEVPGRTHISPWERMAVYDFIRTEIVYGTLNYSFLHKKIHRHIYLSFLKDNFRILDKIRFRKRKVRPHRCAIIKSSPGRRSTIGTGNLVSTELRHLTYTGRGLSMQLWDWGLHY